MPYSKDNIENGMEFKVQPEKAPSIAKVMLPLLILPFLAFMCVGTKMVFIAGIFVAIIIYFMQNGSKYTMYRHPSTFKVVPKQITKQGKIYEKTDIHRIIIRNHIDEGYVFISDYQSYHNPDATAGALQLRQKLLNVSYRIDIECSGKPTTLAGGLNEPTAYALLSDVCKILDFKIS